MDQIFLQKPYKTYSNTRKMAASIPKKSVKVQPSVVKIRKGPLTTKKAVEFLLNGRLKELVCRYCLNVTAPLSELDEIMQIAGRGALYKITIRDIVAHIHPYQAMNDPNFPDKVCEKCLDKATQAYLFAQQCEQSERALRNCFDDMHDKLEKLDPIERTKKRGRQKLHPNYNVLHTEFQNVIEYAEPIRNLINSGTVPFTKEPHMGELECKRCWQVLPNMESLVNHEKIHPKTMWYSCRICAKSFPKRYQMNRHLRQHAKDKTLDLEKETDFTCKQCGRTNTHYNEHLQHIEKHKFKMVLDHLVERKMDKLCAVCFDKNGKMVDMDKMICLHGGYPELTGDRTLYNILGSTVPEMNILHNYTGTKICAKCLDHAITSYIFINKTHYIRNRLDTCITKMIEGLKEVSTEENIAIEISQSSIMPLEYIVDESLLMEPEEIDETKIPYEVLEDEFRTKSEDESDVSSKENSTVVKREPNLTAGKRKSKKFVNGFTKNLDEFLTFKNKEAKPKKVQCRFTCPICNKYFISEYFLQKHILKHVNYKKVVCKYCTQGFTSKFYLYEHVRMSHLIKLKSFSSCQTCGRNFKTETKKLRHQKCHVAKQCDLCLKVFANQKHFDSHMQRHANKIRILIQRSAQNCSFCEKECLNDNDLSIHVNREHLQIKPYSCDMCERQFYTEPNLRYHKKIHSLRSIEKCEFCSQLLKCRRDLVVHLRKHIGTKPYHCFLCSETFFSEGKVKKHLKVWHGGSFCCKLCKKVFVNKKGLKDHVNRAHSFF